MKDKIYTCWLITCYLDFTIDHKFFAINSVHNFVFYLLRFKITKNNGPSLCLSKKNGAAE